MTLRERITLVSAAFPGKKQGLANAVGVHRNTITSWIAGRTEPNLRQLQQLSLVTGHSIGWFQKGII